ncbi:MAG: glycosyltransferase family 4 protein [Patescibacteria group bacterium]|nr:glycosyltransferase family 4 protein [Patescibacteria group bacterium]
MKAHIILPNNAGKVNGGGKVMIRMAEVLQDLGYDTSIEFSNGSAPEWLDINVPIKSVQEADLVIVCEVSFGWIGKVKGFNVVYYQSPTYIERDKNLKPISYKEQGADAVIFNSEWNRKRYYAEVGEDGPIVHPTVDTNLFFPSKNIDLKKGIYFPRKNLGLAVRTLDELKKRGIDINWFCADEVPEKDLINIWKDCGITMITGYPESFPMPPIEAMSIGSVPVGTTGGAGLEYMNNENNSLVVRDGDWQGLADAIERLSKDKELFEKLRKNARDTALRFNNLNQKKELKEALKILGAPTPF